MTPDEFTIKEHYLAVGNGHELYIHDWGNKAASMPIIFLHGGPGAGCSDGQKQQFDPTRQRVIFFDQRGAGQSRPFGSLKHNTTADSINDITTIADTLGIKTFILRGGSWGACLALAYGLIHPKRVHAMVLHSVWTGSVKENEWITRGAFRAFFPEAWHTYQMSVPEASRDDPTSYHFPRILSSNLKTATVSAFAYHQLSEAIFRLDDRPSHANLTDFDPSSTRLEVHYLQHGCFMPDRHLLDNAHTLSMPIYLIHGRYDMVCPPETAYELQQKLPHSELIWTVSGHKSERESRTVIRTLLTELTK